MVEGLKPQIKIIDSVFSEANLEAIKLISPLLKYKSKFYKRKVFGGGETQIQTKYLFIGRSRNKKLFYSGFIRTIKKKFREIEIVGKLEKLKPDTKTPKIPGITLREDQINANRKMRLKQRGIVLFPTGSGKTIIMLGFISMFKSYRILILCHTIDLLNQISEELEKAGYVHHVFGGGRKFDFSKIAKLNRSILLATDKSFVKLNPELWSAYFDITLVDEAHHATNQNINYGKIMEVNQSPVKIGFTATIPTDTYRRLIIEGYFGPVIAELTGKEKDQIIAEARVELIAVPKSDKLVNVRSYRDIYNKGIVENNVRNRLIIEESLKSIKIDEQVLIIVERVEHGMILKNFFREKNISCPFVQGQENEAYRNKIKRRLLSKELMVAISTKVWREGINIPTLNHIIFASGGKDEIAIRQAMGRGLRLAKGKSSIHLTDFMDPYRYLAEHSIQRFTVYKSLKWI